LSPLFSTCRVSVTVVVPPGVLTVVSRVVLVVSSQPIAEIETIAIAKTVESTRFIFAPDFYLRKVIGPARGQRHHIIVKLGKHLVCQSAACHAVTDRDGGFTPQMSVGVKSF
jgi:hypothetical protein